MTRESLFINRSTLTVTKCVHTVDTAHLRTQARVLVPIGCHGDREGSRTHERDTETRTEREETERGLARAGEGEPGGSGPLHTGRQADRQTDRHARRELQLLADRGTVNRGEVAVAHTRARVARTHARSERDRRTDAQRHRQRDRQSWARRRVSRVCMRNGWRTLRCTGR